MRAKIIATIGPSSCSEDKIMAMAQLGVSCFRINFAHGNPKVWSEWVSLVRRVEESIGRPLALMGDLVGPSIRLGELEEPLVLKKGEEAVLVLGDRVSSGERAIPLPSERAFEALDAGDIIVMDDGKVRLRVVEKEHDKATIVALTDAHITSRKAVVIHGKEVEMPSLSKKDLENIDFAIKTGFDYIGLSYVRRPVDVEVLRRILEDKGAGDIGIAAKIETRSAINNLDGIVEKSDIIVVARGDLGMNFSLEEIPHLQKLVINKAREYGKPVAVATQLLESMIENPVPTRAEVHDIYTALEEGADILMVTGETSIGRYPVETISWLRRIVEYAETHARPSKKEPAKLLERDEKAKLAKGVAELADDIGAKILIYTMHGETAYYMSIMKPWTKIYAGTLSPKIARKIALYWGIEPLLIPAESYTEGLDKLREKLRARGDLAPGDIIVTSYKPEEEELVIRIIWLTM